MEAPATPEELTMVSRRRTWKRQSRNPGGRSPDDFGLLLDTSLDVIVDVTSM
jgi:hypothetical protein